MLMKVIINSLPIVVNHKRPSSVALSVGHLYILFTPELRGSNPENTSRQTNPQAFLGILGAHTGHIQAPIGSCLMPTHCQ